MTYRRQVVKRTRDHHDQTKEYLTAFAESEKVSGVHPQVVIDNLQRPSWGLVPYGAYGSG
jgi:hypothetical protein